MILDVMMPGQDGWELLADCKAGEDTRDMAILICSVLDVAEVARTQAATGFLRKPVTQRSLLQALAPWDPANANRGKAH